MGNGDAGRMSGRGSDAMRCAVRRGRFAGVDIPSIRGCVESDRHAVHTRKQYARRVCRSVRSDLYLRPPTQTRSSPRASSTSIQLEQYPQASTLKKIEKSRNRHLLRARTRTS